MSLIPASLLNPLTAGLESLGDSTPIQAAKRLGGGCINHAVKLETLSGQYFLKWNEQPLPGMFSSEAHGLNLLAATKTVPIPKALAVSEAKGSQPAFLLLEWLEGPAPKSQAELGEQLAKMHHDTHGSEAEDKQYYGLDHDNYLGSSPQYNSPRADWVTFFIEMRLTPQIKRAIDLGRMPSGRRQRLERLIEDLPVLLNYATGRSSLIHGDLWSGNLQSGKNGLALVDPAVSYSDREAEIAYTELFGGFSRAFYKAYQANWPLSQGYSERRDIYNLYHLINHLNLFGESYGHQVDAILRRYT